MAKQSMQDIKRRIKSVSSTERITNSMKSNPPQGGVFHLSALTAFSNSAVAFLSVLS